MYLGLTGAVLGTLPTALVYFSTYELCKARLERKQCKQALTHLLSASAGAVLSAFIRVPTDTLKHRTQAYLIPNCWQVGCSHLLHPVNVCNTPCSAMPSSHGSGPSRVMHRRSSEACMA